MLSEGVFSFWDKEVLNVVPCRFSPEDRLEIEVSYPFVALLDEADKKRFYRRLCKLMRMTSLRVIGELKLSRQDVMIIAAPFIILTFGFRYFHWGNFKRVIVYPKAYRNKFTGNYHYGETNPMGAVVLSWKRVKEGIDEPDDALHLIYHEYAHALYFSRSQGNHTEDRRFMGKVNRMIRKHFDRPEYKKAGLIREYGFTNEMEFFAVLVEVFMETGDRLKELHPELYSDLLEALEFEPYEEILLKQATWYRH